MNTYNILKNKFALYCIAIIFAIFSFCAITFYILLWNIETREYRIINFTNEELQIIVSLDDKIILSKKVKAFSEKSVIAKIQAEGAYLINVTGDDFYKQVDGPYDSSSLGLCGGSLYIVIFSDKKIEVNLIKNS